MIARALAQMPDILLMDEPNAHLDIAHQVEAFSIIKQLNTEKNVTVVSVSHDLNLAAAYSDRVAVLVCGSLTALGTPEEVLTEQTIAEAFRAHVVVDRHPVSGAPRISLVPSSR
jgi:iron complex transport system ATP-binding protein